MKIHDLFAAGFWRAEDAAGRWDVAAAVLTFVWAVGMVAIKLIAYRMGGYTSDGMLFANALATTSPLSGDWLPNASFTFDHGYVSILEDHFQPTLLLLAPLVQLFGLDFLFAVPVIGAVVAVLVLERVMLAARTPGPLRFTVIVLFLCNFVFMIAVFDGNYGFHTDSLYVLLLPLMLWAHWRRRWVLFFIAAVLVMGVKENGAVYVGAYCTLSLFFGDRGTLGRAINLAAIVLAACWLFLALEGFHLVAGGNGNRYLSQTADVFGGSDPTSGPVKVDGDWLNLYGFYLPGLFSPAAYLATLPDAVLLHLHGKSVALWYAMPLATMLAGSAAFGASRMAGWTRDRRPILQAGIMLLLVLQAIYMAVIGPLYTAKKFEELMDTKSPVSHDARVRLQAVVPADCGVAASYSRLWLLYDRRDLLWPHHAKYAQYLVLDPRSRYGFGRMAKYVEANRASLVPLMKTDALEVYRQPAVPCDFRGHADWRGNRHG